MIIILIAYFILSIVLLTINKSVKEIPNVAFYIIGVGLAIMAGFRSEDSVRDYNTYIQMYNDVRANRFVLTEVTFYWIASISAHSIMLFVIYAIIGVSMKLYAIKEISTTIGLSLLIYMTNIFLIHEMTQMRAGVSAGILLLSIKYIYERDLKRFAVATIIASLFHVSALLMIPLWFINKLSNRKLLIAIPLISFVIALLSINIIFIIPIPLIREKIEIYQRMTSQGIMGFDKINIFHPLNFIRLTIYYLLLWKYDLVTARNKYAPIIVKIYCLSVAAFWLFATMPVMSNRISELYGTVEIVMIPLLIYVFRPRIFAYIGVVAIAALSIYRNIANTLIT